MSHKQALTPTLRKPPPLNLDAWVTGKTQEVEASIAPVINLTEHTSNLDIQQAEMPDTETTSDLEIAQADKPATRISSKPGRRVRVKRADGRELVRLLVYLPPDMGKSLDVYCAEHEIDKSEVVTKLLRKLLAKGQ